MSTQLHDDLAAYALDALDDGDALAFERHLESCVVCSGELAGLRRAAAALALDAAAAVPPPALRRRVVGAVRPRGDARVVTLRRRWGVPVAAALAAAAALVAIGVGLWAVSLSGSLEAERAQRRDEARALAIVGHPLARRYPLIGARGDVVVTPEHDAALVVLSLGRAPRGKTYQLWIVRRGSPISAGIFGGGREQTVVTLDGRVPASARVAVSLERAGGAAKPTMLLFGTQTA